MARRFCHLGRARLDMDGHMLSGSVIISFLFTSLLCHLGGQRLTRCFAGPLKGQNMYTLLRERKRTEWRGVGTFLHLYWSVVSALD